MSNSENAQVLCKNVFKGGESTTSVSSYTKAWIELINKLEKDQYIHALLTNPL